MVAFSRILTSPNRWKPWGTPWRIIRMRLLSAQFGPPGRIGAGLRLTLAEDGSSLFVHLYIGGSIQADLEEGSIAMRVHSALPWKGRIRLKAEASGNGRTTLAFRLLSWAGGDAATDAVTVHTGQGSSDDISRRVEQGYLYLSGPWKKGDRIDTDFDMPVRAVAAYPLVSLDADKVAVTRGP